MKKIAPLFAFCAILTSVMFADAQDPRIDSTSEYLLLATNRTTTMQKELDDAAGRGFRVVAGMPGEDELVLILERVPQPSEPYAYRLLATHRTTTMERELNEAGRSGFRFTPLATIEKGDEIISIMERSPGTQVRYEYRLLATHRTATLHRELNQAAGEGFFLKGTFNRDERMAILERVLN
jgi:hypothetical protein